MMLSKLVLLAILCVCANSNKPPKEINNGTTSGTDSTDPQTTAPTTTVEPLNVTFAGCDDLNCTQLNASTSEPPISDKNDTSSNKNGKSKKPTHSRHGADANICTCNLQANVCDINCCCDPDCSAIDRAIFRYCELDENMYFDDRYCNYIKYIYVNNTPFAWEVNQEGLFCVVSSNLPQSHLIQNERPLRSIDDLRSKVPFWHQDVELMVLKTKFINSYAFGDPIMIIKSDSTFDWLRIPNNLLTGPCVIQEEVFFLKDESRVCSQVNIDADNAILSFPSFFQHFKVIGNPKWVNVTKVKGKLYHDCPKNVCIEVEPKLCNIHLNNCSKIENITQIQFHCSFNLKDNLNSCQNAVKRIQYKFYHNGTEGLHKVEVLGVISNFSYHFGGEDFQLNQDYSVEFAWTNQNKNYSKIFSGNPGYIVGKPILVGTKIAKNENVTYIRRNSSDFIENFMVFPDNVDGGKCVRNETYNIPVTFGYNLMAKCRAEKRIIYNIKRNATEMCKGIQEAIFDLWGTTRSANQSLVFGLFGNAAPDINDDWNEVLYTTSPIIFLNRTQGMVTNKNTTLVCYNISTLLDVEVFYSRVDFKSVVNQHKILGVSMHFDRRRDQTYSLQRKNITVSLTLSLDLVAQVSFHDITTQKARRFVDRPSFDIRLPYDFFYPFIKIGSGSNLNLPNSVLVVLVVLECLTIVLI